ncbi:MAG: hypothetical protein DYH02_01405 [Candidatus Omnitrophica bacterium COP1]|nr:hypothetical protein [Candidatus Omnitrophica bacterium COP1]
MKFLWNPFHNCGKGVYLSIICAEVFYFFLAGRKEDGVQAEFRGKTGQSGMLAATLLTDIQLGSIRN